MNAGRSRAVFGILAGMYFGVVALASGASEERTFRDAEGREIVARILSGSDAAVTIELVR